MTVYEEQLHKLARTFMDTRPHFKSMSLDEWMIEYRDRLTLEEQEVGRAILNLFASEGFV